MPHDITNIVTLNAEAEQLDLILRAIQADKHGIGSIDFNKIIPMPEGVYRGDLDHQTRALYGENNWYDWSENHWGTKWGAYGFDDVQQRRTSENKIVFLTANGAPAPVIQRLSEMFPGIEVRHEWAGEDIGCNVGEAIYLDGNQQEIYLPDPQTKEACEMAARIIGLDLETTSRSDIYSSPDFQCDATDGFPTVLCVDWGKEHAWLEPAPAFDDEDSPGYQACLEACRIWGLRGCPDWQEYNALAEWLGEEAYQAAAVEIEEQSFAGMTME